MECCEGMSETSLFFFQMLVWSCYQKPEQLSKVSHKWLILENVFWSELTMDHCCFEHNERLKHFVSAL